MALADTADLRFQPNRFALIFGEFRDGSIQTRFAGVARKCRAGRRNAVHQHVDQSWIIAAGTTGIHRSFAAGVALLSSEVMSMSVNNLAFGDVTQPGKRFTVTGPFPAERSDGLCADVLENVFDIHLQYESSAQTSIDV